MSRTPVTGADVEQAVALTAAALREAPENAWKNEAGSMGLDCWDTLDHLNNGLFSYALRLAPPVPYIEGGVPLLWDRPGPKEQARPIIADRTDGPGALVILLEAMGGLVAAMVDARPPTVRAWHIWGVTDPEGFAAMGVVETLVHAFDLTEGLGVKFEPPADLVVPAMARLFPDAPTDTPPWLTLLWATGRGLLEGCEPVGPDWAWHSAPLAR
ncbi:MAG TPA: hypothetical protein VHG10_00285 [Glycomyces sp.]|nr:hypothetical protein [Glycomyces sp.]